MQKVQPFNGLELCYVDNTGERDRIFLTVPDQGFINKHFVLYWAVLLKAQS